MKTLLQRIISLFFFLQICVSPLQARDDIKFRYLNIEHGLSQGTIFCISQDHKGFLWIGTEDGLNRYDGSTFRLFTHEPYDPNSLSNSYIRCIAEEADRGIWIGTSGGLNFLEFETERIIRFTRESGDPLFDSNDIIRCIYRDDDRKLWLGTDRGVVLFEPGSGVFQPFQPDLAGSALLEMSRVLAIEADRAGRIWIGTDSGLYRYDRNLEELIRCPCDGNVPASLSSDHINCIFTDSAGDIWIGTAAGLYRFDAGTEAFVEYELGDGTARVSVRAIGEDALGRLWIGTQDDALWISDKSRSTFCQETPDLDLPGSINSSAIRAIFRDRHANMWVGSRSLGINIWSPARYKFDLFTCIEHHPESLGFSSVRAIYVDRENTLWVGGHGGLDRIERTTGECGRLYRADHYLRDEEVLVLYEDPDDPDRVLWIGAGNGELYRFDQTEQTYSRIPYRRNAAGVSTGGAVYSILRGSSELLWLGTGDGLYSVDEQSGRVVRYAHDPHRKSSISGDHVIDLLEDDSGFLWVGTSNGLNLLDRASGTFHHFMHDPGNANSLSDNCVLAIHRSANGDLWIGTAGGGLNRLNRASDGFEHFTTEEGLPNNVVYGILEDGTGNLWLSTNRGISRFDPQAGSFRNYYSNDGLQSNEFNAHASYMSREGEFFFGGVNGLNSFFPDSLRADPHAPSVWITDIRLFDDSGLNGGKGSGQRILEKSILCTDKVELSYKQHDVYIEFAALHFTNPSLNEYACMLKGLDDNWVHIGKRRNISYAHIPPGSYTFKVKASNCDGVWNEEGASMQLVITPPFWMTWWFRIAAASTTMMLVLMHFGARTRSINKRNAMLIGLNIQLQEQIDEKARIEIDLKESETRYKRLVETAPDIIHEFSTLRGGLYYSPQVETILGYSVSHLLKNPFLLYNSIHSDDRQYLDNAFANYELGHKIEHNYRMRDRNGEWHWFNYRSISGQKKGDEKIVTGIAREITGQKRMEEALLMNQAAVDSCLNETIWILRDGSLGYVNDQACRSLEYSRDELMRLSIADIDPYFSREEIEEAWSEVKEQRRLSYEAEQITKSGRKYPVEVTLNYVILEGKEIIFRVAHNISRRKLSEEKLQKAFNEIKDLKDQLETENVILRHDIRSLGHKKIVGESAVMRRLMAQAAEVAVTDSTVLIMGETGTGKELLARAIHDMSRRKDRPIVAVNCAAMPSALVEAELFGREKGAYTGAVTRQAGRFELADGSSIFLDEIGELSCEAQAKILRILEMGELERLGSARTIRVDVRIIAATNRDLEKEVEQSRFRSDLYFRLNVFPLAIPPLRERREDIPCLVWHFVGEFCEKMGKSIESIHQTSMDELRGYDWPGNVRELRNVIERAMILSKGPVLRVSIPKTKPVGVTKKMTLDEVQKDHIIGILEKVNWRIRGTNGAAEILGVHPSTLESRMRKLGISRPHQKIT